MHRYLIRRVLLMIPTLLIVSFIVFLTIRLIPGGIIEQMVWEMRRYFPDQIIDIESLKRALGLDAPIHTQYFRWLSDILLHGSLGDTLRGGQPVTSVILSRLPVTIELGLVAIVIAVLISLPIGIYSALRQDGIGDFIGRSIAITFIAVPSFWIATLVIVYPSIWWGWSPPLGVVPFMEDPLRNLEMFLLPSFILGMAMAGTGMRMTRTMMLEVLRQDYIRTAYAKGLGERVVIIRHALKNSLIPVVTVLGAELPVLVGGAVILEQIFALPGTGKLLIDALARKDYTLVSGINLIIATGIVVANLLVDISYAYLDPRIRYR